MMRWIYLVFLLMIAEPAQAMFIGTAISMLAGAIGASYIAVATVGRLLLSVAISAYQKRRMKKKMAQRQSGITTQFMGTGGTTPLTIIAGRYATNGHLECPQMSHDGDGKPNVWLTYVIGLGDLPGIASTGRVVINDKWYTVTNAENPSWPGYGFAVDGEIGGIALFRFRTGNETVADPWLVSKYGAYPERPWSEDMIGRGIPHVIVNLYRDPERLPGEPRLRFEVRGIAFYDPRKDSSVGGVGSHRWANRATWEWTENPKVIEYNIHRGIEVEGFGIWGNGVPSEDLPLDNWFAAMNACDLLVDNGAGGTEKAYVFGFEWGLDTEPRAIVDEINRSCGGETVEVGGVWKTRVGGVGLPVYFMTDADILVTRPQELDPFRGLDDTNNAFSCSFPDPEILWEAREAPPLTNAAWELEDGSLEWDVATAAWVRRPRRLLREVSLPAVSNHRQVQRLISGIAAEGRKRISHVVTLPPDALALEPLDAVVWTSARNNYAAKLFEAVLTADPVFELRPRVGLLEADPSDHTPPVLVPLPPPSTTNPPFLPRPVVGFDAVQYAVADADGAARRPAIRLIWDGAAMAPVRGIAWQVRVAETQQLAAEGSVQRTADGGHIVDGLLPATLYQARARAVSDRPTDWSGWETVETPDVRLSADDFAQSVWDQINEGADEAAALAGITPVDELPTEGERPDQIVLKRPEMVLYRWTGAEWSTQIHASPEPGSIDIASFAAGIRPLEIVETLPATGNFAGRTVFLTSDSKIYRHTGSPSGAGGFVASIAAGDIAGQVSDAQIAGMAASKVTGQLTDTQIADLDAAKLAGTLSPDRIGTGAILAAKIADNAITTAKIAANAITAGQLAANAVTASKIADAAITVAKFAAGIEPVGISTAGTLPTTKTTTTLVWQNDLYRWNGTAYVKSVAAADISGTLAEANLASIAASKITGQLSNAQIAALDAAKLSGTLSPDRIGTGALLSAKLADNAVTTAKIAAGAVTAGEIAANAVTSAKIADAALTTAKFAAGIEPVGISTAGSLPTVKTTTALIWQNDLYRWNGSAYVKSVAAADISGQLSNAQIADLAAAKVTGQITSTQITDSAVSTAKLAAGAITTAKIAAGAVTANEIAANAITAGKIAAGAVTATEIAANAVTAGKIAAAAVSTAELAAGAVRADKLAIGFGGNLLFDSTFTQGLSGWGLIGTGATHTEAVFALRGAGDTWAGFNYRTLVIRQLGTSSDGHSDLRSTPVINNGGSTSTMAYAVTPGETVEFSVQVSLHRCDAQLRIQFSDASGAIVGYTPGVTAPVNSSDSANPDNWPRHVVRGVVPAGAAFMTSHLRKLPTLSGSDSWMFVHKPMLCRTVANASEITPWSPSGGTYITRDGITTNAITADKIAAGAVVAGKIAAGTITAAEIAAGTITAAEIASNAITAVKIDAGAVTTGKIAANAVTANEIASNAVTAVKISAGAVEAAKIAAGAILADKIAAGAVVAGKIAANAVEASNIAAGAIVAGKIAVGAVSASEIAAGAITAEKLVIRDFTNIVPNGDFSDPYVGTSTADLWNPASNGTLTYQSAFPDLSDYSIFLQKSSAGASANVVQKPFIPVEGGAKYYGSARFWTNYGGTPPAAGAYFRVLWYNESKAALSSTNQYTDIVGNRPFSQTVAEEGREVIAPAAAKFARFQVFNHSTQTVTTNLFFGKLSLVRMSTGELIVDGAITANKVAAGAITAAKIAALTITAAEIAAGTITGAKVAANTITATQIAAGTITAAEIASNAITAVKIAAGAITAGKIAAGAVVADDIASNAVTAVKISARAVEAAKIAAGAILADKIAAGAVVAGKIAANAVEASNIAANAIVAGKIAAGAVSASEIAAGAITAEKLVIRDFTNIVPNGDCSDPYVGTSTADLWNPVSNGTLTYRNDFPDRSDYSIFLQKSSAGASANVVQKPFIPVEGGAKYYGSARFWTNHGGTPPAAGAYFRVLWYNENKVGLSSPNHFTDIVGNRPFSQTVAEEGREVIAPAAAKFARFEIYNHSSQTVTTNLFFGKLSLVRMSTGELIVDGAITANKIAVGAVTANSIAAGAVIASKIAAGAVVADKLSVASLSAISATIGLLRTATSGARMEIHNDKILIYDASNIVRVRMGNLT